LSETLFDEEIVLLMHSTVATLTGSAENFEASSQSIIWIRMCGAKKLIN